MWAFSSQVPCVWEREREPSRERGSHVSLSGFLVAARTWLIIFSLHSFIFFCPSFISGPVQVCTKQTSSLNLAETEKFVAWFCQSPLAAQIEFFSPVFFPVFSSDWSDNWRGIFLTQVHGEGNSIPKEKVKPPAALVSHRTSSPYLATNVFEPAASIKVTYYPDRKTAEIQSGSWVKHLAEICKMTGGLSHEKPSSVITHK